MAGIDKSDGENISEIIFNACATFSDLKKIQARHVNPNVSNMERNSPGVGISFP